MMLVHTNSRHYKLKLSSPTLSHDIINNVYFNAYYALNFFKMLQLLWKSSVYIIPQNTIYTTMNSEKKKKWCISKINKTTLQWCLISLRNQQPELSQANTYIHTHTHKMNLNCTLQSLFSQIKWKTKIQHCKEICNGYADLARIAFCCTHRNCKHYQSCHDLHLNTCVIIDWLTESSFCFWNICTQWVLQIKT